MHRINELKQLAAKAGKRLKDTGFFHIFGTSVISKGLAVISGFFVVRLIPKADYGVYSYANNILHFFMLVTDLGMISASLQLYCENRSDIQKAETYFRYGSRVGLSFNVILAATVFLFTLFFKLQIEGSTLYLRYMCLLPVANLLYSIQQTKLRVTLQNKRYATTNLFSSVSSLILYVVLSFILFEKGLILANYIHATLIFLFCLVFFKTPVDIRKCCLSLREKKDMFKIALISMANNGISELLSLLDIFILGLVLKDEYVIASYKIATYVPSALVFIPLSFATYIYPYFAEHRREKKMLKHRYTQILSAFAVLNAFITLCLLLFAPLIIRILFGVEYLDAVAPFRVLSVSYFFSATFRIISGNLLVTQRKLLVNTINAIASGVINIVSNVFFILWLGSVGAAITTLIVTVFSGLFSTFYMYKVLNKENDDERLL